MKCLKVIYKTIAVLAVILLLPIYAYPNTEDDTTDVFMQIDCPESGYVGQYLPYNLYLYSSAKDVSELQVVNSPEFGELETIKGQTISDPVQVKKKGKIYWRWNVGRSFISASKAGNYVVAGGKYVAYIARPVIVNDFFFGSMRSVDYDRITVETPSVKVKFKDVNKSDRPRFTGAIGDFSIVCWLPPGDIVKDKEALAIVKISGEGLLRNIEIPEISSSFSKYSRLKSIDRQDNVSQKDGKLYSEIILECIFVPMENKGEVSPVSFTYFDAKSGKYKTIETEPQPWNEEDEYSTLDKSKLKIIDI